MENRNEARNEETYHVTFSKDDEAITKSSIEGDEINFNENRSFPDDKFLVPRSKVSQSSAKDDYFSYVPAYDPFSTNNITILDPVISTNTPILQDIHSYDESHKFSIVDDDHVHHELDVSDLTKTHIDVSKTQTTLLVYCDNYTPIPPKETMRASLATLRLVDEEDTSILSNDMVNSSSLRMRYFSPTWRVLMVYIVKCFGAEHMIVVGAENCPPMLDKSMYYSWQIRMWLYNKGKKNGRMMLESIENGSLVYPTIKENGQMRNKKYEKLTEQEKLQDNYDV
nr:hypothetical protein [Tanacetum cinerariifolium]